MTGDSHPQPFVRKASGLVKEFGVFDTFVFNTLGYALGLVLALAPTFLGGIQPNADIYAVLTIGTILTLFNGLTYGLFSAAMPRSGGDYVYIGRTLHPALGFTANWGFTWSQFFGLGAYTAWCVSTALSPGLATFGYITGSDQLVAAGETLATPFAQWLVGTMLLVSVLAIQLGGLRWLKRFFNTLFVVALLGTVAMIFVLLSASRSDFVGSFNDFMQKTASVPNAYDHIIQIAKEHGLTTNQPTSLLAALLALPVGYWFFIGFTYSVYIGGEIKEPQKSQLVGIIGSLLFGYIVYMVAMGRYYAVVGRDFNNAVAIVQGVDKNLLVYGGSMSFFAGLLAKNTVLNLLVSLSTFLWYYLLLFVMVTFCVRNVFAWSFDRIMPKFLTTTSPTSGSPWPATFVIVLIAEAFLTVQAFWGLAFINYIAIFSVCFLITGVAAVAFPYRRKDLFDASPVLVRRTLLGLPLIVIAGIGNIVLFVIVLYSSLTNPGVSGVQGRLPGLILLLIYGAGLVIYYLAKRIQRTKGVSFDFQYSQIPPE